MYLLFFLLQIDFIVILSRINQPYVLFLSIQATSYKFTCPSPHILFSAQYTGHKIIHVSCNPKHFYHFLFIFNFLVYSFFQGSLGVTRPPSKKMLVAQYFSERLFLEFRQIFTKPWYFICVLGHNVRATRSVHSAQKGLFSSNQITQILNSQSCFFFLTGNVSYDELETYDQFLLRIMHFYFYFSALIIGFSRHYSLIVLYCYRLKKPL